MTKDERALIEEITTNYGSTELSELRERLNAARAASIKAYDALWSAEELYYLAERALLAECREIKASEAEAKAGE